MLNTEAPNIDHVNFSYEDSKDTSRFEKAKIYDEEKPLVNFFAIETIENSDDNKTRITLPVDSAKRLFGIKEGRGKTEIGLNSGSIGNERVKYSIDVKDAEGVEHSQPYSATALEKKSSIFGNTYETTGDISVRYEMGGETYNIPFKIENPHSEGENVTVTFEAPLDEIMRTLEVAKKGTEISDGVKEGKDIDKTRKEEIERNHDAIYSNDNA